MTLGLPNMGVSGAYQGRIRVVSGAYQGGIRGIGQLSGTVSVSGGIRKLSGTISVIRRLVTVLSPRSIDEVSPH